MLVILPLWLSLILATVMVHLNNQQETMYGSSMIDRRLEMLRAVARHGTVTAAAEACHLTPSAASHQLKALARTLDVHLLEHTGRNVRLTAAAHTLLKHADALAAQWEHAQAELGLHRSGTTVGPLRLCGFSSAAAAVLPDVAARLRITHAHLTVQVSDAEPRRAFDLLATGDVDIAVVVATPDIPSPADPAFEQQSLFTEPLDLVVPSDHRLSEHQSIALADAAHEAWIVGTPGSTYHQLVLLACASAGFAPNIAHHASEWDAGAALVAHGFGVALVPRLAHLPEAHRIVRLPLSKHPVPTRHVLAAIRAGSREQPAIAAGLAALRRIVADTLPDDTLQRSISPLD